MRYKGKDGWSVGDMWGLVKDGVFHGIHIKWSNAETPLGHVRSDDLLHFTACEDILYPLPESEYPDDCLMKYTGCCITAKDGTHCIYYTMRSADMSEKIALATSTDMENFELYPKNPVLEADERVFYTKDKKIDCRDMLVVYVKEQDTYYGYFAAMAEVGYPSPTGVIGVAKSKDLVHWADQNIAYTPPFVGVMEVPDVFYLDGKWYLIMLTGNNYGAKGISEDEDIVSFTTYAVSDSPEGPFVHTDDKIFLGGNNLSGAVCRTVVFDGERYVLYLDRGKEGMSVALPKIVRVTDGKLRPCYAPIVSKLRTGNSVEKINADMIKAKQGSFAWQITSGNVTEPNNGTIRLSAMPNSYQKFLFKNIRYRSCEIECFIKGDCAECGVLFEAFADSSETPKDTTCISLHFERQKIIAYQNTLEYNPYSKRSWNIKKQNEFHLRIIASEGVFEVYIDDVLALQGPMETADFIIPGLMIGTGNCEIKAMKIYELEKDPVGTDMKINVIGDSITRGTYTAQGDSFPASVAEKPWCVIAGEKLGLTNIANYGINGTSVSSCSPVNSESAFSLRFEKMRDDANLVIVAGGTNDFGTNVKLGTADDTTDISFCGGLRVLCEGLKRKYPSAKVVFILPIHRTDKTENDNGNTLLQYCNAIAKIAHDIYGFYVIDGNIPLFSERARELLSDGVHPTPEGHVLYGNYVAEKLREIIF